jgi:hypothetical protein
MAISQIVVKRYKSDREYQADAKRMISKGYEVQTVTSEQPRSGCGRIFLIGIFAAIFKPKPVLVVTYRLSLQDFSRRQDFSIRKDFSAKQDLSRRDELYSEDDLTRNDNISKW